MEHVWDLLEQAGQPSEERSKLWWRMEMETTVWGEFSGYCAPDLCTI